MSAPSTLPSNAPQARRPARLGTLVDSLVSWMRELPGATSRLGRVRGVSRQQLFWGGFVLLLLLDALLLITEATGVGRGGR